MKYASSVHFFLGQLELKWETPGRNLPTLESLRLAQGLCRLVLRAYDSLFTAVGHGYNDSVLPPLWSATGNPNPLVRRSS